MKSISHNPNFKTGNNEANIIIISGSCCIPGMAPFDEQARHVVEQAVSETEVRAGVKVMQATSAYMGGVPREVLHNIMKFSQSGKMPLPAVIVNGTIVSYGVPEIDEIKKALVQIRDRQNIGGKEND